MIQGLCLLGRQGKRNISSVELQVEVFRERKAEESFPTSKLFSLKLVGS